MSAKSIERQLRAYQSWQVSLEPVTSLAFLDRWLFVATVSGELIRIDISNDSIIPSMRRPDRTEIAPYARSGDWAPDGSYAVVGSFERIDRIAVPFVNSEKKLPMHSSEELNVSVHDLLPGERIQQRDLDRQSESSLIRGYVPAIAFASDGQSVALATADGIAIWTEEGQGERILHQNASLKDTRSQSSLSFSRGSNRLVWDSDERVLSIAEWNATEWRVQIVEQPGPGDAFAWSPSGQRLAFGGVFSKVWKSNSQQ